VQSQGSRDPTQALQARGRWVRFAPHLRGTTRATAGSDVVAGITVTALAIPQAMAFALVAGVPAEMGLLAAALPALVAALLGSSRTLVTGPTNTNALLIGVAVVAPAVAAGEAVPIGAVLVTSLLCGLALCAFALVGLGRASRFLSDSVLLGFMTGAGVLIALRQLPALVGGVASPAPPSSFIPGVWPLLVDSAGALASADPRALGLALAVPVGVVLLRRLDARIPAALLVLGLASAAAVALGWTEGPDALRPVGVVPADWTTLGLPPLTDPGPLAAPALALALLSTVQSMAAARSLSVPALGGERLDPDRELFSQGAANVTAAFVGALPTSGSLTRSALLNSAGGRSRLAAATSGALMLVAVPVLAPWLGEIPLAALVGLVVLSGLDLLDLPRLRRAGATRGDALVLATTLAATLWIDLVQAVYVGVFLSLMLLVRRTSRLHMVEIVRAGGERFREIAIDERTGTTPAVLLHLEGDLNFAVAEELAEELRQIAARGPRVIVLRLKRARYLDATVLEGLREVTLELRAQNAELLLCGLTDTLAELLRGTALGAELGEQRLLRAGARLFEGFERALERCRSLLDARSDEEIFRTEVPAAWSYEI
jgi:SulP family sulfate permease